MTERDMEELWEANCQVIREALAKAGGGAAEKIRGIACSGHGKGLYLWGKDNKPAYNGIVSTDGRAWKYPEQWQKDGTAEKAFEKTYQRILASQPVSILNWFKEHSVPPDRRSVRGEDRLFRLRSDEPEGPVL